MEGRRASPTVYGGPGLREEPQLAAGDALQIRRFEVSRSTMIAKRVFDIVVAALALVVLAPLLLIVAIAVKLDSPGPILFAQQRIGRGGLPFRVLKFRSMDRAAEGLRARLVALSEGNGVFKLTIDPRVTRSGRWMRRTYIDELPQLLNVLRGQMSLVGPRPLPAEEDALVHGAYRRRLDVPPGITGPWQVRGSWRVPLEEMVELDYEYAASLSLWADLKLIVRTVPAVFSARGI